jgi:cathepsin B
MWKLFLIASLAALALTRSSKGPTLQDNLLTEEEVDEINKKATTWTADYNLVIGMTREKALSKLGTFMRSADYAESSSEPLEGVFQAPISFDARVQWPNCVNYIRNQGQCGGCWAFASSEVLSDRYCIRGTEVLLSPQYLISCVDNNYGCQGGYPDNSWTFLHEKGIPTNQCVSYKSGGGDSGVCPSTCDDGSPLTFYNSTAHKILTSISDIQLELMTNGPMHVGFTVYEDFMSYTTGIYKHVYGEALGGHGVKLVGWGRKNGTNYWICANSWSTYWGEKGFFRIAFGECGIDRRALAGMPTI